MAGTTKTKKTDNDLLGDKIAMRLARVMAHGSDEIRVLDCFGGQGVIWKNVQRISGKRIIRTAIDKRHDLIDFHIHGDNTSVLDGLEISGFDMIDIDAYGIPIAQLDAVIDSGFKGVVFVTAIQVLHGALPEKMLADLGFPDEIKKIPSLPARRGWEHMKNWLAMRGVTEIHHRSKHRKHYFWFDINDAA